MKHARNWHLLYFDPALQAVSIFLISLFIFISFSSCVHWLITLGTFSVCAYPAWRVLRYIAVGTWAPWVDDSEAKNVNGQVAVVIDIGHGVPTAAASVLLTQGIRVFLWTTDESKTTSRETYEAQVGQRLVLSEIQSSHIDIKSTKSIGDLCRNFRDVESSLDYLIIGTESKEDAIITIKRDMIEEDRYEDPLQMDSIDVPHQTYVHVLLPFLICNILMPRLRTNSSLVIVLTQALSIWNRTQFNSEEVFSPTTNPTELYGYSKAAALLLVSRIYTEIRIDGQSRGQSISLDPGATSTTLPILTRFPKIVKKFLELSFLKSEEECALDVLMTVLCPITILHGGEHYARRHLQVTMVDFGNSYCGNKHQKEKEVWSRCAAILKYELRNYLSERV